MDYIAKFIIQHGWEIILIFILVYAFIGDKILSIYAKKSMEKILESSFYNVNMQIKGKISEVEYEKTFIQFMNGNIRKYLYSMLAFVGIIQAVFSFYFVENTDIITYQVALFTIVIAVFEYKNNNELTKEKKVELSEKEKNLIELKLEYTETEVSEIVQRDVVRYRELSDFDKLYECYQRKHSRKISIKRQGNKRQEIKASIQSDKDDKGKFIIIEKKVKVPYLPEKLRENHNIKLIQERRQDIIIYIVPDTKEEIKIEIPY